ncbi:MAG: PAS domain S-box protein [Gallionella sp.]|nr:PAS domain S-box protein [Gallionella sp.]
MVFSGVNFFHKDMLTGFSNFTGVAETFEAGQTIGIMGRLHPGARRIVVIIDSTTTGEAIRKELEPMVAPYAGRFNFEFWNKLSLDQLRVQLPRLGKDTLVLLMPYARDYAGTFVSYPDLATMVSQLSPVPVYGTYEFYMGYGITGGRLTSGEAQGKAAAEILLRVLGGEDPNHIPVMTVAPSEFQFDSRQLHRYGIVISDLPSGSRILYQSWYELYRIWVWMGGLLILISLVLAWGWLRSYQLKRRSDIALKQSKEQLEAILNATTESIFHVDENGIILAINDIAAHRVQKEPQDMIGRCAFDFFPPEVSAKRRENLMEVFRSGKVRHTEDKRGDRFYSLNYYPIAGNDGKVASAVVYAEDITERRHYQTRLEHLLSEQKALLENDLVGIVTVRDRKIIWANPAFEKMLGYGTGELAGMPTRRTYTSEEAYQALEDAAYPALSAGKIFRAQTEHLRKDGTHIWLDLSGTILDPETGESLWGFIDITERKHAEELLQEQKNFLSAILENEPECVKVLGAGGMLLQMNPAGLAMLEADSVEEANAHGLVNFVMQEHRAAFLDLMQRVFKGETGVLEFQVEGKRGTRRWLETHATPLRDSAGKITYLLGVTRDVTRRREAEERLALSLRGSDLAMTDWHIPSDTLTLGNGWMNILGYQPDELCSKSSTLAELVRPEDALRGRDSMMRHLKGQTPYFEAEVRMRHKDGHWVWVMARGMAVERSADGRAVRVAGTAMDISQRKQAEAEISRLSQWNELLLNSAGEGIFGVDREGRCSFINPTALAILGFSKEEVLGKNQHDIFHHHRKDGSFYPQKECPIYQTLSDGIRRGVEDAFIRKNGEIFPVQLTVTPMHENGQIVGVEAVFQDIAQRKEMEQELKRLATTDPLTGVSNRRHLIEQLEMELAHVIRFGKPTAFLMVDIDHFKRVNDTYGHATGDAVLKHFADMAKQRLRRIDLLGRLGGEEFGIMLPGTDSAGAALFAERFRGYVADTPTQSSNGKIPVTISIGIAMFNAGDTTVESIMARADAALYRAKESGRNRIEIS